MKAAAGCEHDVERAAIERILASDVLHGCDAQRRLLIYLAEKSLAGEAGDLKEYTVGVEAMRKPPEYDPQKDSSVRMQAARLREKLTHFYEKEGAGEPVVVEFPKGRFKLNFHTRPVSVTSENVTPSIHRPRFRWIAAMTSVLVVATSAWVLLPRSRFFASASSHSAVDILWGPFLHSKRPVLLSLGSPLFVDLGGRGFFRLPGMDDWYEAERKGELRSVGQRFPGVELTPGHPYTGIGEATGAFYLGKLFGEKNQVLRPVASDTLTWSEIGGSDVIFVGPPKFNTQLKELPVRQDLELDGLGIRNLHPRPGEPTYIEDASPPRPPASTLSEAYALITRIPGLHDEGEVLVCASNWTAGTLAAVLYMTREDSARELIDRMRGASGEVPRHYQVVVKATLKGYTPIAVSYVLHHQLKVSGSAAR